MGKKPNYPASLIDWAETHFFCKRCFWAGPDRLARVKNNGLGFSSCPRCAKGKMPNFWELEGIAIATVALCATDSNHTVLPFGVEVTKRQSNQAAQKNLLLRITWEPVRLAAADADHVSLALFEVGETYKRAPIKFNPKVFLSGAGLTVNFSLPGIGLNSVRLF